MPENNTDDHAQRRPAHPLGYALNVFPYHTLAELWTCLENEVVQRSSSVFSPTRYSPSNFAFRSTLYASCSMTAPEVARLKHFLDTNDLALITVNGFVMPAFHGERVKERVYLLAWHESDARVRFTNACLDLLSQLPAPPDAEFGFRQRAVRGAETG